MDELFEAETLIQTRKIKPFPIVFYGGEYWKGLMDWIKGTMLAGWYISPEDTGIFSVADTPEEAAGAIISGMKKINAKKSKLKKIKS
jgi:predicted Rossmann-fold nucleotide-binding protein